jgi:hypothetical protein
MALRVPAVRERAAAASPAGGAVAGAASLGAARPAPACMRAYRMRMLSSSPLCSMKLAGGGRGRGAASRVPLRRAHGRGPSGAALPPLQARAAPLFERARDLPRLLQLLVAARLWKQRAGARSALAGTSTRAPSPPSSPPPGLTQRRPPAPPAPLRRTASRCPSTSMRMKSRSSSSMRALYSAVSRWSSSTWQPGAAGNAGGGEGRCGKEGRGSAHEWAGRALTAKAIPQPRHLLGIVLQLRVAPLRVP